MDSIFDKMADRYAPASTVDALRLVEALRQAQADGLMKIDFSEAEDGDRLPWAVKEHVMDCDLSLLSPLSDLCFGPVGEAYGSGCAEDQVGAAAHAASEALERVLTETLGQKALRPSAHSAWSVLKERWIHLPYNPLAQQSGGSLLNPHYSRSGEAFHLQESEALRAAYCEVLERDALNRGLTDSNSCQDITEAALRIVGQAKTVSDHWDALGYDLRLLLLPSPFGVMAVMAVVRARDDRVFRAVFKGVAADFGLKRAVEQALSELGRNAYFGAALVCQSENDLQEALRSPTVSAVSKPNLVLLSPRYRWVSDHFWQSQATMGEAELRQREASCSPEASRTALEIYRANKPDFDLWAVPVAANIGGIPGYAWKFIALGLRQNCHLFPFWKDALI